MQRVGREHVRSQANGQRFERRRGGADPARPGSRSPNTIGNRAGCAVPTSFSCIEQRPYAVEAVPVSAACGLQIFRRAGAQNLANHIARVAKLASDALDPLVVPLGLEGDPRALLRSYRTPPLQAPGKGSPARPETGYGSKRNPASMSDYCKRSDITPPCCARPWRT